MEDIFKSKKREKDILTILTIGLLVSVFALIALTNAYFSNTSSASGEITLGEIDFFIYEDNQSFENILPSQTIPKVVTIVNSRNRNGTNISSLCSILLRFSIGAYVFGEFDSELSGMIDLQFNHHSQYQKHGDIYYYNSVLNPGSNINLCDGITFLEDIGNEYQNLNIEIEFLVEAIQAENDAYIEVWQDAPKSWVQTIQNQK